MRKNRLAISVLLFAAAVAPALAQDTLPPGPGMEETVKACGGCHTVGTFRNIRRSSGGWETTMLNMIGWGASFDGDLFDVVLDYLTTYLGTSPPPPAPAPAPR